MSSEHAQRIAERFQLALDLYELSERMLRQKLRRKNPQMSDAEIDAKVDAWLAHRPGAEHGDGEGRAIAWPGALEALRARAYVGDVESPLDEAWEAEGDHPGGTGR